MELQADFLAMHLQESTILLDSFLDRNVTRMNLYSLMGCGCLILTYIFFIPVFGVIVLLYFVFEIFVRLYFEEKIDLVAQKLIYSFLTSFESKFFLSTFYEETLCFHLFLCLVNLNKTFWC